MKCIWRYEIDRFIYKPHFKTSESAFREVEGGQWMSRVSRTYTFRSQPLTINR